MCARGVCVMENVAELLLFGVANISYMQNQRNVKFGIKFGITGDKTRPAAASYQVKVCFF